MALKYLRTPLTMYWSLSETDPIVVSFRSPKSTIDSRPDRTPNRGYGKQGVETHPIIVVSIVEECMHRVRPQRCRESVCNRVKWELVLGPIKDTKTRVNPSHKIVSHLLAKGSFSRISNDKN